MRHHACEQNNGRIFRGAPYGKNDAAEYASAGDGKQNMPDILPFAEPDTGTEQTQMIGDAFNGSLGCVDQVR